MSAYAEPADMTTRHDATVVASLCSDDGHEVPSEDLATDPNLLTALQDASGDVEAALLIGKRYSVEDLEGLTGNSLAKLQRITCTIAMANLLERRPVVHVQEAEKLLERAEKYLEQLRTGQRIFNLEDQLDTQLPTVDGPTSVDCARINLLPDRMTRYFPTQVQRLPTTRG
jgi:phage gp36-like protein